MKRAIPVLLFAVAALAARAASAADSFRGYAHLCSSTGKVCESEIPTDTLYGADGIAFQVVTGTHSATGTQTSTATEGYTSTLTNTATNTVSGTGTISGTASATNTATVTMAGSGSFTGTQTYSRTGTTTITSTYSNTDQANGTSSDTITVTSLGTGTNTVTATLTVTMTGTTTATGTNTGTGTASGTASKTSTVTGTQTATATSGVQTVVTTYHVASVKTQTGAGTYTDYVTLTTTQTATASQSMTNTQTFTNTASSTASATDTLTNTSTSTSTSTGTRYQTVTVTNTLTDTATATSAVVQLDPIIIAPGLLAKPSAPCASNELLTSLSDRVSSCVDASTLTVTPSTYEFLTFDYSTDLTINLGFNPAPYNDPGSGSPYVSASPTYGSPVAIDGAPGTVFHVIDRMLFDLYPYPTVKARYIRPGYGKIHLWVKTTSAAHVTFNFGTCTTGTSLADVGIAPVIFYGITSSTYTEFVQTIYLTNGVVIPPNTSFCTTIWTVSDGGTPTVTIAAGDGGHWTTIEVPVQQAQ